MKRTLGTSALILAMMSAAIACPARENEIADSRIETFNSTSDEPEKNVQPLSSSLKKAVGFPKSIEIADGLDEVFLHIYISEEGRVYVLEAYSANTQLKKYVIEKLHQALLSVPAEQRGRSFEFTMHFTIA